MRDCSIASDARSADLTKVRQARSMTEEQRVLSGPRLFAGVCDRMREGLRDENPGATAEEIDSLLRKRLDIVLNHRRRQSVQ